MTLNAVPAWIIDFVTAHKIVTDGDSYLKDYVANMCRMGAIKFCGCERDSFNSHDNVKKNFYMNADCACKLCLNINSIAMSLPNRLNNKSVHCSDNTTTLMVACAIYNGYGILSSKSGMFLNPIDLALHKNLPCLTLDQFSLLIPR